MKVTPFTEKEIRIVTSACNSFAEEIADATGINPCHIQDIASDLMVQAIRIAQNYQPGKNARSTYVYEMLKLRKDGYISSLHCDRRAELINRVYISAHEQSTSNEDEHNRFLDKFAFDHPKQVLITDIRSRYEALSVIEKKLADELRDGVSEADSKLGLSEWEYRCLKNTLREKFQDLKNYSQDSEFYLCNGMKARITYDN